MKVWNTLSGFCFVTFVEHTAAVSGVAFTQSGKAILSSSLDGTVRAFDLTRSGSVLERDQPELQLESTRISLHCRTNGRRRRNSVFKLASSVNVECSSNIARLSIVLQSKVLTV